jgi:formate-nitrite transporter family protein
MDVPPRQLHEGEERGAPPQRGAKADPEGASAHEHAETVVEEVEKRSVPPTPVIYQAVRKMGEEEMARPATSLWWSGVAAGLSISFSLLAQSILYVHLPDTAWRPLVTSFGYCVGFLMVVLSRQQLFTEQTISVVLPVMAEPSARSFVQLARIWSIVLAANLAGTLFAALFCTFAPVLTPEVRTGMLEISRQILAPDWLSIFFRGISAGFLIAAMVWIMPGANAAQFHVVALMTYLIAASDSMHIVAGSVESFLLVVNGQTSVVSMLLNFTFPVLLGNIVGGTALFALISHAQVVKEL